jgi:hypothetical protein
LSLTVRASQRRMRCPMLIMSFKDQFRNYSGDPQ